MCWNLRASSQWKIFVWIAVASSAVKYGFILRLKALLVLSIELSSQVLNLRFIVGFKVCELSPELLGLLDINQVFLASLRQFAFHLALLLHGCEALLVSSDTLSLLMLTRLLNLELLAIILSILGSLFVFDCLELFFLKSKFFLNELQVASPSLVKLGE